MKILLTGVTGYIGRRLLPILLEEGHMVYCGVRDLNRFDASQYHGNLHPLQVNFLKKESLTAIPRDIDAAYYLIHSMSASTQNFEEAERMCAENFCEAMNGTQVKQVIYLSGIVNEKELSPHLRSRKTVEDLLSKGNFHLTTLRAGIIVGSGSASFEIIRDLVEKLPIMIAPKWLNTKSQPIAIRNVIQYLRSVLFFEKTYNKSFDIGGPEILSYKEMLLKFAKVRKLKRLILTLPLMTTKLSSYWLYFVTSTSYKLAVNLVDSMKIDVTCQTNQLSEWLGIRPIAYEEAVLLAFDKIAQQEVISSWTDALSRNILEEGIRNFLQIPVYGCLKDQRSVPVADEKIALQRLNSIGGENGWYYANWLWEIRGFVDKIFGGVGLRRGRRNQNSISTGETLDFWRVLYVSNNEKRLILYAEMKLPGEAWLEFKIENGILFQIATFRPIGLWGRIYWYSLLPFHDLIFGGMAKQIAQTE